MRTTLSSPVSAHPSGWTAIGLACIATLAISTACSLAGPTPPPAASSLGSSSGPQSGPLTKGRETAALVGEVVATAVVNSDMQCFISWDVNALCRWFTVVAPANGVLSATLRANRAAAEMELFALPGGVRGLQSPDKAWRVSLAVVANQEVSFAAMAYFFPEPFTLLIEFQ